MKLEGNIFKDGKFWLAEIPLLDLLTQGHSRKEAYVMAKDVVISALNKPTVKITLEKGPDDTFFISASDSRELIALMLKQLRRKQGFTVRQASAQMGSSSPNAYGVYEQGRSAPTLEKLEELIGVVEKGRTLLLKLA